MTIHGMMQSCLKILFALFPAVMVMASTSECAALEMSHYADNSVLDDGLWVKISVDTTGVYALSYDRLRELGFDKPEKVYVYGSGAVVAADHNFSATTVDDLPLAPCIHADNKLIFYGEGDTRCLPADAESASLERCLADSESFYFLGVAADEPQVFTTYEYDDNAAGATPATTSLAISVVENEKVLPGEGGAHLFDGAIAAGASKTYVFDISDISDDSDGNATGYFSYSFVADAAVTPDVTIDGDWTLSSISTGTSTTPGSNDLLTLGTGSMSFTGDPTSDYLKVMMTVPSSFTGSYCGADCFYVIYSRNNVLGSHPWRAFNFVDIAAGAPFSISDVTEDVEIWNITDPLKPVRLGLDVQDGTATAAFNVASASGVCQSYVAFSPSAALPEPAVVGTVYNQNLHAERDVPEMIIITTATLEEKARELADIHSALGLDTKVVCQDLIFNEFSSGSRLPQGIRRYIKMLYDADTQGTLKYVLLYGPAVNDNRFITRPEGDYLPTYENEIRKDCLSNVSNYNSDMYYGILDDNSDFDTINKCEAQLSVGRLPVTSTQQAADANAKIEYYLNTPMPTPVVAKAFFISDHGNSDKHYLQSQTARDYIKGRSKPTITSFMANISFVDDDVCKEGGSDAIRKAFTDGTAVVWYAGHGSAVNMLSNTAWTIPGVLGTANSVLPFGFLATCEVYGFDVTHGSIVEAMVLAKDRGMIGCVSSGRTVYLSFNANIDAAMAQQYAAATEGDTFADIFRKARNAVVTTASSAICTNTMAYNYCGDPSIPIPLYSHAIEVTEVAGVDLSEDDPDAIDPQNGLTVKAKVVDDDYNTVAYSGIGVMQIYRPSRSETYTGALAAGEQTFDYEDELLAEYPVTFKDGVADISVALPAVDESAAQYRLFLSMRDTATSKMAAGMIKLSFVAGEATADADTPYFDELYLNTPEQGDGATVSGTVALNAFVVIGNAAIQTRTTTPVAAPKCILDGGTDISKAMATSFDDSGRLHMQVTLPQLTVGRHYAEVSIVDPDGERISQMLSFTVADDTITAMLTMTTPLSTVRSDVEIDVEDLPDGAETIALLIVDADGNGVRHVANPTMPYTWNLTDDDGAAVADGPYSAYLRFKRDGVYGSSDKLSFVVIR